MTRDPEFNIAVREQKKQTRFLARGYSDYEGIKRKSLFSKMNTSYGIKSFKYQGVKTLNHLLSKEIYQNSKSKANFLKHLKSELILQY